MTYKSLLFSGTITLFLLNGSTCIAMYDPSHDPAYLKEQLSSQQQQFAEQLRQTKEEAEAKERTASELKKSLEDMNAKLQKDLENATRPYEVHSTYGTCPDKAGEAMAEFFKAQAHDPRYKTSFIVTGAIADTAINKIAAPIFVDLVSPAAGELWQKHVYQTELQGLTAENKKLEVAIAQLKKDRDTSDNMHQKKMDKLSKQYLLSQDAAQICSRFDGGNSACSEIGNTLLATHRNLMAEHYKDVTGKEFVPTTKS